MLRSSSTGLRGQCFLVKARILADRNNRQGQVVETAEMTCSRDLRSLSRKRVGNGTGGNSEWQTVHTLKTQVEGRASTVAARQ